MSDEEDCTQLCFGVVESKEECLQQLPQLIANGDDIGLKLILDRFPELASERDDKGLTMPMLAAREMALLHMPRLRVPLFFVFLDHPGVDLSPCNTEGQNLMEYIVAHNVVWAFECIVASLRYIPCDLRKLQRSLCRILTPARGYERMHQALGAYDSARCNEQSWARKGKSREHYGPVAFLLEIVLLTDGYYEVRVGEPSPSEVSLHMQWEYKELCAQRERAGRFFSIVRALPIELQMRVANLMCKQKKLLVSGELFDLALKCRIKDGVLK